jgi:signal transduction histidine kinase
MAPTAAWPADAAPPPRPLGTLGAAAPVPSAVAEALAQGGGGRHAEALRLAHAALQHALALERGDQAAAALDAIGLSLMALGEHQTAIEAFDEGHRLRTAALAQPLSAQDWRERSALGATLARQALAWLLRAQVLREADDDAGAQAAGQRAQTLAGTACTLLGEAPATAEHGEAVLTLVRAKVADASTPASALAALTDRIAGWLWRPLAAESIGPALLRLAQAQIELASAAPDGARAARWVAEARTCGDRRLTRGDLGLLIDRLAWEADLARGDAEAALRGQQRWVEAVQRERAALAREHAAWTRQSLAALRNDAEEFVTHDLRGPLAVALAQLDASGADGLPAALADRVQRSGHGVRRALDIADNYLIVIRAEHLQRNELSVLDLAELTDDVCEQMAPPAGADVRLERDIAWDVHVNGDRILLMRALANLLSNAFKHAPPGSAVTVRLARHGGDVELTVADRGSGMPMDMRVRLFQRHATGAVRNGNGLGLAMVARVARLHEARIQVDSDPGRGTCVSLLLAAVVPA